MHLRFPLTAASAIALPAALAAPLHAAETAASAPESGVEEDPEYAPNNIVITAAREGYGEDDGSTATKTDTPLIDVPQTVSVITRDQLDDQNIRQLNEALRYVPGVTLETGEGHRDQVFIRGQASTADFYLDGLRDDAQYYRALFNIERVEVLKGANALIFGRGGGGGAINRVSKKADPTDAFVGGSASVDTFGAFAFAADVNQPLGEGFAGRLNATYEEFASHRDFYSGRFIGVAPTVTADLGPATRLTASYSYTDDERVTDRGIPSLNGLPLSGYDDTFFGDPDYNDSFARVHIARTRLTHEFAPGVSANATLQYADYDKFYANIVPSGATATTATLGGYESGTQRENLIGQANLVAEFDTGSLGHTLLLGAEFAEQDTGSTRDRVLFDDGAGGTTTSVTVPLAEQIAVPPFVTEAQRASTSDLSTMSLYAQEQLDIGILQLVAGVRYDRFDLASEDLIGGGTGARVDERVSPRLGVIAKPMPALSFYASYAESFLPQSGDQFSAVDAQEELLDPELFKNLEAGVKWAVKPDLLVTASVFRLDRSNTQAPDPANPGFVILAGESRVEGVELSVAGELVDRLQVNLGYTYLDGEIRADTSSAVAGTVLQQLPTHQIGAWARYAITDRLGFGMGVVHQSDQFASLSNAVVLPAYTRVDTGLFYEASDALTLQLNVENLFDEGYYASAHGDNNIQPAKPLNASLTARMKF